MEKLAKAFLREAEKDLERAERAFKNRDYPDCAFRSQQCIEKCVKALLELKKLGIRNHGINLSYFLRQAYFSEWNVMLPSPVTTFLSGMLSRFSCFDGWWCI